MGSYVHFCCVFCVFSSHSELVYLQSTIHQHLWNLLIITPTTTVGVHSLSVYAGVDGVYFALNSRQQPSPRYPIFLAPAAPTIVLK